MLLGRVEGYVKDSVQNDAIAGVTVKAKQGRDVICVTYSGNTGYYGMPLPAGTYKLVFKHKDYDTLKKNNVVVVQGQVTSVPDVQLVPE